MNKTTFKTWAAGTLAVTSLSLSGIAAEQEQTGRLQSIGSPSANGSGVEQILSQWSPRPQLGAREMIAKYGQPQEATTERLVWHNAGAFKRITVTKIEHHHDFPLPHMDFLQHTINYQVPADKAGQIAAFDGSCTFDCTKGELSARCDLEGHNILTLNLANDIVTGKMDAQQARQEFSQNIVNDVLGKHPAYVETLQFKSSEEMAAAFSDVPTIPGAPKRATEGTSLTPTGRGGLGDAEILAFVVVANMNEINAASYAEKQKIDPQVLNFAKMLHEEHGKDLDQTMKLGQQIHITPSITPAVDQLSVKGATELGSLVPLQGDQFGSAYVQAMVNGHTEVLNMIDGQLLPAASNDALRKHLTEARNHVAMHLEQAKKLASKNDQ